ncbi:NAD-dependent epimerase/dehydratase family protein [Pelomonas sp. SE-A7]|uniref:UDP-2-acetamido-2,6-beta-L-arabino-hexul-4-ose reductase n=1 Tax=Pelomonas sp. SE-A7 TaxID=3054953 RepID=UPI00259C87A1|nr:NAD-dependent epimerase/dehydratase family protein [Pelomonas sp. SE-A7]MDM4767526.1 NAD-dependent epimerase/dehydratase family protein [Pelomonas sp. SE-A7]
MRIAITGASGFVGRNLRWRLKELGHADVRLISHQASDRELIEQLQELDFVFHLAGVNRPLDPGEFDDGNADFSLRLTAILGSLPNPPAVAFASSTQAALDNSYGLSKRAAEDALLHYSRQCRVPVYIFRLTNVFGKWCRPNYNSVVATFCHNIARDLPVTINDPCAPLRLVYIDDVIDHFLTLPGNAAAPSGFLDVSPSYETTVGELAETLRGFRDTRSSLLIDRVGTGLKRALYATYVSYLPTESFDYQVPRHADPRGVFVEMLKTPDGGQFSYFTAGPGITRGEHYHHTKTEKFLVIKGTAHFGFRHIDNGDTHELVTRGGEARIVETIPGWTHNITNIGEDELIVMLWANEVFDRARPDTVSMKVSAT